MKERSALQDRVSKAGAIIYPGDNNRTRAEIIVWALGFRGAVGDKVLSVMDILDKYDDLEQARALAKEKRK